MTKKLYLKNYISCMWEVYIYSSEYVKVRGQLGGISSLLPLFGCQGLNLRHQPMFFYISVSL